MGTAQAIYNPEARFVRVEIRIGLYREQAESEADVIAESNATVACFEMADLVKEGVAIFESINSLDDDSRVLVYENHIQYSASFHKRLRRLYDKWHTITASVIGLYSQLEQAYVSRGFEADPVSRLQSAYREVSGLLTDDAKFFTGDVLVELRDAAIDAHRRGETVEGGLGN